MNQELQRIKIAEACGYSVGQKTGATWELLKNSKFTTYFSGKRIENATLLDCLKWLPDYPNDLNAIHEAEKSLQSAEKCRQYADWLDDGNGGHFATAAQRAEAFLRTLNLWEE